MAYINFGLKKTVDSSSDTFRIEELFGMLNDTRQHMFFGRGKLYSTFRDQRYGKNYWSEELGVIGYFIDYGILGIICLLFIFYKMIKMFRETGYISPLIWGLTGFFITMLPFMFIPDINGISLAIVFIYLEKYNEQIKADVSTGIRTARNVQM